MVCVAGRENGCADRECTDEFGTCVRQKERDYMRYREDTIRSRDEARKKKRREARERERNIET